jgi:hypothetical protein
MFVFTPICFDVRSCFNDVIYIYFPCSNTLVVPGEIVTDITIWNSERKYHNRTTQNPKKMNDATTTKKKPTLKSGARKW